VPDLARGHIRKLTKDGTSKTACNLKQECDTWRDVILLSQTQVLGKELRLRRSIKRKACEVEVGKRPTREKVTGQHLTDGLLVELESSDTELSTKEQGEEKGETHGKEETPSG
jgi:hypothetical protein